MDDLKTTFKQLVDLVKFVGRRENGKKLRNEDIAKAMGMSREYLSTLTGSEGKVLQEHIDKLREAYPEIINESDILAANHITNSNTTVRQPKTETNPEREGVIFVPIAAQANYAKSYTNPVYLNQLERVYIPGFPYRGDAYRIFEVAGDSMEPTFKEGYHVVTEYIEPTFWSQVADFYTYVVVTENQVMLKRIFKKSDQEFVLISDNEDFHPQIILPVEKIKEIWFVKRKLDWEMSPPKRFEIKV